VSSFSNGVLSITVKYAGNKNMKDIEEKRNSEKQIVKEMIEIYCKHNHDCVGLCDSYREILNYSCKRIDSCPFMETKTFCSKCSVHCFDDEMSEKIREVMKFSGPRIFLYHPLMTIRHAYLSIKK